MKELKRSKKYSISKTLRSFKDKITLKELIKELIKKPLKDGISFGILCTSGFLLGLLLRGLFLATIADLLYLFLFISSSWAFGSFVSGIIELIIRNNENKTAENDIEEIIEDLKNNDLNLTKNDLRKSNILEMENIKGTTYLKNGKTAKKRKVINYIAIKQKDKLKIIKEVTTNIKKGFSYKTEESKSYLMNNDDLIREGIIYKNRKLTEKGKKLILKSN